MIGSDVAVPVLLAVLAILLAALITVLAVIWQEVRDLDSAGYFFGVGCFVFVLVGPILSEMVGLVVEEAVPVNKV